MTDFRAKAAECLIEAEQCRTAEVREVLLSIAKVWDSLALEASPPGSSVTDTWAGSPFWASSHGPAAAVLEHAKHA